MLLVKKLGVGHPCPKF